MNRTIPLRLNYCDTVTYFDFSSIRCLYGVIKRAFKYHGKCRPDMGGYCPGRFDLAFFKSAWNFNKTFRIRYHDMLKQAEGVNIIIVRNRRQVKRL